MSKVNKKIAAACIMSMLCAGSSLGFAAEQENGQAKLSSFALDEYVVTATGTSNKMFESNANISVVDKEEIERMHYETVEDVLRTMTNIQFLNYGMPGYNMNRVRINGSEQVVVLIDGVRATMTGTGKTYPFHLISDMDNIERIEVLKGAAAVLYGSDAKGGVVNIITKKDADPKTKLGVSKGNFGKEEYQISTEGKAGDLTYRVYGQKKFTGDYEDGAGVEWEGHSKTENMGVMLKQDFAPGSNIVLNYTHGDEEFGLYDPLYDQLIDGDAKSKHLQITYNQEISDTMTNSFSITNSRFEHKGILMNNQWGDPFDFWNDRYKSKVINDTLIKTFGDTHVVSAGFEFTKSENLNPKRKSGNLYNECMKNSSYFLQDEWTFDDHWKLTSGVRYDDPEGGIVDMDSNISKSFNLGYKFNQNTNMYAAYNDYFVLPSMYQLYSDRYGNAKLLPEQGKNYEVGFNHMIDDSTMLNIHYFKRNSEQNIGFDTDSNTYVNDTEKAHGFDVQLEKQFNDAWHANIGYSRLSYENKKGTTDFGYLPKNLVTMGVVYTKGQWDIGVDGKGFIGRDGKTVKSEAWPSDRYWVFDVSVNYKANDNVKLFAKCNNIFDTEYAEHTNAIWGGKPGDWYGMPGRNFVVGAEYTF